MRMNKNDDFYNPVETFEIDYVDRKFLLSLLNERKRDLSLIQLNPRANLSESQQVEYIRQMMMIENLIEKFDTENKYEQ